MKQIDQVLPSNAQKLKLREDAPNAMKISDPSCRLPVDDLEAIWLAMTALYGHRWTSAYGVAPSQIGIDIWGGSLYRLTQAQISTGLEACITRNDDWPPNVPQFRAMCLGIPSLAAVKAEFLNPQAQRSRFALLVWRTLDAFAFRTADQFSANRLLTEAYDVAREQVMRGAELPEESKAVTYQPHKPVPAAPAVAERHLGEIRELLHVEAIEPTAPVPRETLSKIEEELSARRIIESRARAFADCGAGPGAE